MVGPNGCGKSNIVDAILWGLGEPKPRNLRAANQQDIIFGGSQHRKPLGYAEVSLHFDNEDGSLPIDAAEVVITRRINRDGESEYSINKQSCRQKDLYDLLADSGLGKAGYAIVGQKEIDAALLASAEERRAWIDEAAGVQRYRAKRVESLRRLEQTREHLERVEDILREIERQRGPLEEEAAIAREYKQLTAQLAEIESALMVHELRDATVQLREVEARLANGTAQGGKLGQALTNVQAQIEELGEQLADAERKMDALRDLQRRSLADRERAASGIALAEEKLRGLDELESSLHLDQDAEGQRVALLQADLESAGTELEAAREALSGLDQESNQRATVRLDLQGALKENQARLDAARQALRLKERWESEKELFSRRRRELERELAGIEKSRPDLELALREAATALQEAEAALAEVRVASESDQVEVEEAREQLRSLDDEIRRLSIERGSLDGRRKGLEATLEAHEGLSQGSRAVLALVEAGELEDVYQAVGLSLEADPDLALAIETALGGAVHDLIVPSERDAKRAIEVLKSRRLGRATFQPVTLMRPRRDDPELGSILGRRGVLGIAADLVRCDAFCRPVIESLLARTLIVETIDDALALAKTRGWSKLVTLDGEIVHASGAVSGGVAARQGSGIVQRKAELDSIEAELGKIVRTLEAKEQQKVRLAEQEEQVRERLAAGQAVLKERQQAESEARRWMTGLQEEWSQLEKGRDRAEKEIAQMPSLEAPPEPEPIEPLEADRQRITEELGAIQALIEQSTAQAAQAQGRVQTAEMRLAEVQRRQHLELSAGQGRTKRLEFIAQDRAKAQAEIEQLRVALAEATEQEALHADRLSEATQSRQGLLESNFQLSEQAKELEAQTKDIGALMHRSELERARLETRRATARERLLEAYEIDEEAAMAMAETVEVDPEASVLVPKLRREIRGMGDVNVGAIEAFDRLTERHAELDAQRQDVLESEAQIHSAMKELDQLTSVKFKETFDQVSVEFEAIFQRLFGGGEGKLLLSQPDNILETGVEIEVQPPGKTRKRLELLSGGERALAASALIFALLKAKPSPLVIFDEVDAPLDGRNVERFLEAMRGFYGSTQFLCITHNNLTIEAAPIWFGVTMQEPGVTTVIPYRGPRTLESRGEAYLKG